MKDSRFAKYYVKTDNFTTILDVILDEYIAQQNRLVEIYVYNESQRKQKIQNVHNVIFKMMNEDCIINNISEIWKCLLENFEMRYYTSKVKSLNVENKLKILEQFGIYITKVNSKKFIVQNIA